MTEELHKLLDDAFQRGTTVSIFKKKMYKEGKRSQPVGLYCLAVGSTNVYTLGSSIDSFMPIEAYKAAGFTAKPLDGPEEGEDEEEGAEI